MSVEAELSAINVKLNIIQMDVSSLKKTVNGNGDVGVVGKVAALETTLHKHSRQTAAVLDMRKATRVALLALCGTLATAIVSLIVALS